VQCHLPGRGQYSCCLRATMFILMACSSVKSPVVVLLLFLSLQGQAVNSGPTTAQWTWSVLFSVCVLRLFIGASLRIGGSSVTSDSGVFGTKGVPASSNRLPNRYGHCLVRDSSNLYVFGGYGWSSSGYYYYYRADLWRFSLNTVRPRVCMLAPFSHGFGLQKLWTWIGGTSSLSASAVYGVQAIGSPTTRPSAKINAAMVIDKANMIWLLHGYTGSAYLSDVWTYSTSTSVFTW
jgi:hypothetical protein